MVSSAVLKQTLKLSSEANMPVMGLGTWRLMSPNIKPVLEKAVELGCRHIDCAAVYENEKEIGAVLKNILSDKNRFNVKREDVHFPFKITVSSFCSLAFHRFQVMEHEACS